MGTIATRSRKDGSPVYTAQVRIRRAGKLLHSEAQSFDRKREAQVWLRDREAELAKPGAIEELERPDPILREAIERYLGEHTGARDVGRTKRQCLNAIGRSWIGRLRCSKIGSREIVDYARQRVQAGILPQTAANDLSHLASVFRIGKAVWGFRLDYEAMCEARDAAGRLRYTSKPRERTRRPTREELDQLMHHFGEVRARRRDSNNMQAVTAFAIYSTRRLSEICNARWDELDEEDATLMVRDMKNPGQKIGNDVLCRLTPEALAICCAMPRNGERIFNCNNDAVSAAFTRACQFLGIEDLRFHDLRHHGVSRLFELGWTIPEAASVSGHRSWSSLKRYSHYRKKGDCMEGWPWLKAVTG